MSILQFSFYVPESHLELVKDAVFASGAGKIGQYSKCCWQTLGQGQFIPGDNSNPTIGYKMTLVKVDEFLVNIVCSKEDMPAILSAFFDSHPYEEPAYSITPILTAKDF
jgi:hypothetical protein